MKINIRAESENAELSFAAKKFAGGSMMQLLAALAITASLAMTARCGNEVPQPPEPGLATSSPQPPETPDTTRR
ncbi:hypothetical protein [Streptomyces mirabilis]|uniref:hypothetical protein n=1 Tax=Streptomyces mirabilis TaxID=68239 RepID=UPI0036DB19ED